MPSLEVVPDDPRSSDAAQPEGDLPLLSQLLPAYKALNLESASIALLDALIADYDKTLNELDQLLIVTRRVRRVRRSRVA
jgi:hypothetical protein